MNEEERDARMETLTDAIADAHRAAAEAQRAAAEAQRAAADAQHAAADAQRSIVALDERMIVMVNSVTTLTELFDRHLRRDHGYGEPDDN